MRSESNFQLFLTLCIADEPRALPLSRAHLLLFRCHVSPHLLSCSNALGNVYPAYASYKAVLSRDPEAHKQWLCYWCVGTAAARPA